MNPLSDSGFAPSAACAAARAQSAGVTGRPITACSTAASRHGTVATPPTATRAARTTQPAMSRPTAAEVSAALKKAGALWAPYQSFRELAADRANVLDNPMFTVLDQPGIGRYPVAGTPFQFGVFERQPPRVAPTLGQHTDEILSGILGLSDREIGKLHDDKVIGGPT